MQAPAEVGRADVFGLLFGSRTEQKEQKGTEAGDRLTNIRHLEGQVWSGLG